MAKRLYSVNDSYFNVIDTESKAYWLGFLYADGNIAKRTNEISLELKDIDFDHVEKFRLEIDCEKPIRIRENRPSIVLNFSSKQMKQDLVELGCVPAKSNILEFPGEEQVSDSLVRHFVRGYVDGDGCISRFIASDGYAKQGFSLVGTKMFLTGLLKRMEWPVYAMTPKGAHVYEIKYGSKKDFYNILDHLYCDAVVFLPRKYEIYSRKGV